MRAEELITKHEGARSLAAAAAVCRGTHAAASGRSPYGERLTLKNVSRGISSIHFYCLFCPEVGSDMQEGIRAAKLWCRRTVKIRVVGADEQIKAKYRPESVQEAIYKNVCHT